ncbi:SMI1/KNR4 family protein [Clostridium beijerinckii]|uniref:Cell wall assembly regulator SMI1 n=1 Tax=Clostridium beijerinckii TaxID=1520 RepID=A0A9Q5CHB8_CLOBE|nr:SMI1/KNR4 family protein [Clostridium beijerinckii]AQS07224.1 SMI1 / KNR4 family protein [Clostridium beijerinckii]MBA2883720.1 cell wall assembly regulator SMI1 [Clostridium beijerinckii]MBA2898907.1 cell wall assembly regulator SMI1 [Clostridium beijerinckii]MBA2908307.1 cell wall assembly regulator SMI1 [Clostridium beijerinckii]MBA9013144.1 cell wall assembly regulator SMI1 [Clostridium beijerinckii]
MYNNNKILDTEKSISEEDIKYVESKYKFSMPEDIKKHHLKYNGGHLKKSMYTTNRGDEFVVSWFIPIKSDKKSSELDAVLADLRGDKIIPDWLIPFADEAGGDFYCYSLRKNELGAIYYWSHEFDDVVYITKSLEEFLNNMVEFSY